MSEQKDAQSSRNVVTNELRNVEEAAYWFGVEFKTAKEVGRLMHCTEKQARTLKQKAEALGLISTFNSERITDKDHLVYLQSIGLAARVEKKLRGMHHNFRELKIFDSGGTGGAKADIELRLHHFSRNAGRWLKMHLKRAYLIGVAWGITIRIASEQLRDVETGRPEHEIAIIPTCGEPLGTSAGVASSSRVACILDKALNPHGSHALSLAGIPAMIARKFQTNGTLPVVQEFLEESPVYVDIFKGRTGSKPLISQADCILTSVATRTPLRMAGNELLKIANVDQAEWGYFVGDIGGVLLPKDTLDATQEAQVKKIRELWTGVKVEEYQRIANTATDQTPGVIVLAIDKNKCAAIIRAIELGWVNRLACDRHLAEQIARKLKVRINVKTRI